MAVINGTDYRNIALELDSARTQQLAMKDDFFDAVYIVVLLNAIEPEVDLLNRFWGTYQVNSDLSLSSEQFLSAIRALQNHVLSRGGFTTVDDYLQVNGVTVPQNFADLSAEAGFTIGAQFIG